MTKKKYETTREWDLENSFAWITLNKIADCAVFIISKTTIVV